MRKCPLDSRSLVGLLEETSGLVSTLSINHLKCGSKSEENGPHFFIVVSPSVTSFPSLPVVGVVRGVSQRHPTQLAEAHNGSNAIVVPVVEARRNVPPSIEVNVRRDVGNSVQAEEIRAIAIEDGSCRPEICHKR